MAHRFKYNLYGSISCETRKIGLESSCFIDIGLPACRNRLRSTYDPILFSRGISSGSFDVPIMLQCLVPGRRRLAAFVKEERYGTHISNIRTYTRHRRNNAVLNEFHLPILGIVIPNRNDETILQCRIAIRLDTGASTATRPSVEYFFCPV